MAAALKRLAMHSWFRSQLYTRSARVFFYIFISGFVIELYLLAIWDHRGAGPTHDQRFIIFTMSALMVLYTLYQMFIVQVIPFYLTVDWINRPASTKQVQTGWRAIFAGVLYLVIASIVPLIIFSL